MLGNGKIVQCLTKGCLVDVVIDDDDDDDVFLLYCDTG